ncbi:MAG: NAD(P)-binding domain-containing protein [Verrucomicrobiota bacterium]
MLDQLKTNAEGPMLVLDTCQRLETYGFERPEVDGAEVVSRHEHEAAFRRLARIAAGVESRILGELEILGQVRDAYKVFRELSHNDAVRLDNIFQDVLRLARKARRESGIDRNLISLSGLAVNEILRRVGDSSPVAVVGAGSLAGSVVRNLSKRGNHPVRVASRCPENALKLATRYSGFSAGLDELSDLLKDVSGIILATAAPHPVLYLHHLETALRPLHIIDMGEPPDCAEDVIEQPGIDYLALEDVEAKANVHHSERRNSAVVANTIIADYPISRHL